MDSNTNEHFYTLQPFPNRMPRSIKELREALEVLSKPQLEALMIAEARANNSFAGKIFDAHETDILMRLNTNFDFSFLAQDVEWAMVRYQKQALPKAPSIDTEAVQIKIRIREVIAIMKTKVTAGHVSPSTKKSAVFCALSVCESIAEMSRSSLWVEVGHCQYELEEFMGEVLALMDARQLDEMVGVGQQDSCTLLQRVRALKGEHDILHSVDDLLTDYEKDSSEDEDSLTADASIKEWTPTTPQPGDPLSVLFMDD